MRSLSISGVVGFVFLLANGIHAQELTAIAPPAPADHPSSFMHVFSAAEPPHGFVAFCQEDPDECTASSNTEKLVAVSPGRLRELDEVNRWVNQSIMPQTDLEHYGVKEYWTIPTDGKGDCEDYALLKRHMLMQRGWPSSALLMTVVIDESGEGHAVLTARTQAGDLILDNKVKEVRQWTNTPYELLMRQSSGNPQSWVYLEPAPVKAPVPIAVVRTQH